MSTNFTLTLVRHGQTAANKASIIQGTADVPLSDVGRSQAQKLGLFFNKKKASFDKVYSSDLSRALETATLIIGQNQPISTDKRLRERAYGVIEGQHLDTYRNEARKAGYKEKDLSYYTPEGGETLPQVNQRIKDFFFSELIENGMNQQKKILLVTHGGVIREFFRYFRDECNCDFHGHEIMRVTPNTAVNELTISVSAKNHVVARYVKIHDRSHLDEERNGDAEKQVEENEKSQTNSDGSEQSNRHQLSFEAL